METCDSGYVGMSLTVSMKKQVSTASHCPACGSLSSVSSAPYISSKSPGVELQQKIYKRKKDERAPATKEKSDPEGRSDGRTSGIFTGRSREYLEGIFENEWMYGYMVCCSIDSVLGHRLGRADSSKLGSVLVEDEVRGEEHVMREFVSLTSETWWAGQYRTSSSDSRSPQPSLATSNANLPRPAPGTRTLIVRLKHSSQQLVKLH